MCVKDNTDNVFLQIKGKTIALVYVFEGEDAPGFEHYHIWKSDVISEWLKAIQDLQCVPFILDVRTFVEKAMNNTLPTIDFVINLNCGSCDLSPMGLVPSVCGFLSIPCIPCDTAAIVSGENKRMANLIAAANQINVPKILPEDDPTGIYRPLNFGSSVGVRRGKVIPGEKGIYQEFIQGYDMTTPIVYNPVEKDYDIFPSIIFIPDNGDVDWYYGEEANITASGFTRKLLPQFTSSVIDKYKEVVKSFSINTFCRIDARIECKDGKELADITTRPLDLDRIYFAEINPMPSIRNVNNEFHLSFSSLAPSESEKLSFKLLRCVTKEITLHNYLLACSMLANPK